ncbi:MAG: hypothetical protein Q9N32_02455 [Gammaproteobacteria bacterium]|nr:hypothetical protein [Gammaproteobacteria bacterium]
MNDPIMQMLAYELAVIFLLLSIWLIFRAYKKNKQVQSDAIKLAKKVSKDKDKRSEQLTEKLASKYGLTGEALSQAVADFQEKEQQLNKTVINLFVAGKKANYCLVHHNN